MKGYLLDTNCVSEAVRLRPEPRVISWLETAEESLLFLSVLTVGEIRKGVASLAPSKRRTLLETWLEIELPSRFSSRILSIDAAIADRWGSLTAIAKSKGRALSIIDGLLAATAIHHNLTVVSRNDSDFVGLQVPIFNPWKS
ncbi:MAG TPA: type II toxin-antitoxin system VapC family toxin [Candidatus Saccharimonadales bacterium]|jgi:predicted nucleic acid-binding protein|nr:type II toxin-antitoxin system VapC family toxin [Candidatus Saccharimonadales bacterium]